ncbi:MAG: threonylcarbamoyl-AMP synthase [Erysipelotrichaceae bacterium]|nr:threonylcarbamoyl-AMP synthase [Erysipelotrichaceae bacterium]
MEILEKSQYKKASKILQNGGLIAFPTETVYGLGVIFDNEQSYERLINVKRRPPEKPFTLMCGSLDDIKKYAYVNELAQKLIDAFMPGQFTIILKAKENLPRWVVSKEGNVGIRISDDKFVQNLIIETGKPLLVPSANRSGENPCHTSNEVKDSLGNDLDAIIIGESVSNIPSTIVFVDDSVHIIRLGEISESDIKNVIKEKNN